MSINNIHQLAEHFGTTKDQLTQVLSNRAKRDLYIAENVTCLRIETFVGRLNTSFEIVCHYPFKPAAVEVFVDTICHTCTAACDEAFDDNVDIVANMTDSDPLAGLTVENEKGGHNGAPVQVESGYCIIKLSGKTVWWVAGTRLR